MQSSGTAPDDTPAQPSPFERLLGADSQRLPLAVQRVHALRAPLQTSGRATAERAPGVLARVLCWFAGLPKSGGDMPVAVRFAPDGQGGERWERRFGDRTYASTMTVGVGRDRGFLIEHFGLFKLQFRLTPRADGLTWTLPGWRLFGLPLPRWSVPKIECLERADGERFTFDIDVTFPLVGWVIRYRGWLMPDRSA